MRGEQSLKRQRVNPRQSISPRQAADRQDETNQARIKTRMTGKEQDQARLQEKPCFARSTNNYKFKSRFLKSAYLFIELQSTITETSTSVASLNLYSFFTYIIVLLYRFVFSLLIQWMSRWKGDKANKVIQTEVIYNITRACVIIVCVIFLYAYS